MKEWKEAQSLFAENKTPEEICILRAEYAMKWYIRKANRNKRMYYTFSFTGILCPLVNAVLVVCGDYKVFTAVLSAVTSFAASFLAFTNARLKWEIYRSAAESLKREVILFQAKVGTYKEEEQRVETFLHTIEGYMEKTHINWQRTFAKEVDKKSVE